ncbi:uracil-DNA glycosylase family protein [Novosphingobium sp.]|uniref:uracil-DNA glycosylase family protein n=1 Tax=Novosphingobium sp. TaxID=1874826 RepID=UPI0026050022|nr:uracil-DNA glycosylase family protein [Novosphingobium sp.]
MVLTRDYQPLARLIEDAYQQSGNELGWRLLYSPAQVLDRADVAFIGLNPGGSVRPADHAEFACEIGSAYETEQWAGCGPGESPLQRQVRAMFAMIDVQADQVLAGNLVPFRSPTWRDLVAPAQSLEFGRRLWSDFLAAARPRLVVTMGSIVGAEIASLLGVKLAAAPTGWGNVAAQRGQAGSVTLIALPHLSRFRLFDRAASHTHLQKLFAGY